MDIAFPLAALGQDQNPSPGQHTDTLAFVANEISSLTIKYQNITVEGLPQGVGQDNPGQPGTPCFRQMPYFRP